MNASAAGRFRGVRGKKTWRASIVLSAPLGWPHFLPELPLSEAAAIAAARGRACLCSLSRELASRLVINILVWQCSVHGVRKSVLRCRAWSAQK